MNEQTIKMLEDLARSLGTTAEYLWEIMVRQAPINSFINLLLLIFSIILGYVLIRLHIDFLKEDETGFNSYENKEDVLGIPMLFGFAVWLGVFMYSIFSIRSTINGFINPEYWALNEILNKLQQL